MKEIPIEGQEPFRPDLNLLLETMELVNPSDGYVLQVMRDCWAERPEDRPDFHVVRSRLKKMKDGKYVITLHIVTLNLSQILP